MSINNIMADLIYDFSIYFKGNEEEMTDLANDFLIDVKEEYKELEDLCQNATWRKNNNMAELGEITFTLENVKYNQVLERIECLLCLDPDFTIKKRREKMKKVAMWIIEKKLKKTAWDSGFVGAHRKLSKKKRAAMRRRKTTKK